MKNLPFYVKSKSSAETRKGDENSSPDKENKWRIRDMLVESVLKPVFKPVTSTYSYVSSSVGKAGKYFYGSKDYPFGKKTVTKLKITDAGDDWTNVDKSSLEVSKPNTAKKPKNGMIRDFSELEANYESKMRSTKHKSTTENIKFKSNESVFPFAHFEYPSFEVDEKLEESNVRANSEFPFFEQCLSQVESNFSHFDETPNPDQDLAKSSELVVNIVSSCHIDADRLHTLLAIPSLKERKLSNKAVLKVLSLFDSDCSRIIALKALKPCLNALSGEDLLDFMDLFGGANNKYIAMECAAEGELLSDEEINTVSYTFADEEIRKQSVVQLKKGQSK